MTDPTVQVLVMHYSTGAPDTFTALMTSADVYIKFKHV